MDGIFGILIWLIIIFIWIFSASKKTKRKDSESGKETPSEFEKKILEALGISFPKIPEPPIQEPPEREIEEKIHYAQEKKEAEASCEVPKPAVATVIVEETEREFPGLLTAEKLQEGIVFSIILGPPKAYRFLGFSSKSHPTGN